MITSMILKNISCEEKEVGSNTMTSIIIITYSAMPWAQFKCFTYNKAFNVTTFWGSNYYYHYWLINFNPAFYFLVCNSHYQFLKINIFGFVFHIGMLYNHISKKEILILEGRMEVILKISIFVF